MAAKKRSSRRSPHPGVKLKKRTLPGGGISWRAVYEDPDTEREVYKTLETVALPNADARKAWAVGLSKTLSRRRAEIDNGAARKTGTPLPAAVQRYFDAHPGLAPRTKR